MSAVSSANCGFSPDLIRYSASPPSFLHTSLFTWTKLNWEGAQGSTSSLSVLAPCPKFWHCGGLWGTALGRSGLSPPEPAPGPNTCFLSVKLCFGGGGSRFIETWDDSGFCCSPVSSMRGFLVDICHSGTCVGDLPQTALSRHASHFRASLSRPMWGLPLWGGSAPPHPTPSLLQPSSPLDGRAAWGVLPRSTPPARSAACFSQDSVTGSGWKTGECPFHTHLALGVSRFLPSESWLAQPQLCCAHESSLGMCWALLQTSLCFFIHFHFV